MEYVEGASLKDLIERGLSVGEAVEIVRQVLAGAQVRARPRDRPPRPEAPERAGRRGGARPGDRLRDRPRRRLGDHPDRLGARHRPVPLARAGAGAAGHGRVGHLLDRRDAVRGAHRPGAVRGRLPGDGGAEAGLRAPPPAERAEPGGLARARRGGAAGARQGPRRTASRPPRSSCRRSTPPRPTPPAPRSGTRPSYAAVAAAAGTAAAAPPEEPPEERRASSRPARLVAPGAHPAGCSPACSPTSAERGRDSQVLVPTVIGKEAGRSARRSFEDAGFEVAARRSREPTLRPGR